MPKRRIIETGIKKKHRRDAGAKSITLYIRNPRAQAIHSELTDRGIASRVYETTLLENYAPLNIHQEIQATKRQLLLLQKERDDELADIGLKYEERIRKVAARLAEIQERAKQSLIVVEVQKPRTMEQITKEVLGK